MLVNIVHVWAYSLQGFPAFLTVAQVAPNVTQVSTWRLLRKLPFGSSDTCLGVLIKAYTKPRRKQQWSHQASQTAVLSGCCNLGQTVFNGACQDFVSRSLDTPGSLSFKHCLQLRMGPCSPP